MNNDTGTLTGILAAYGTIDRIAGASREEICVLVTESFFEAPGCVVLAYSRNCSDGLCGGFLAYALKAPLILTASGAEKAAAEYVQEQKIKKAIILGDTVSVSDDTVGIIFTVK